MMMFLVAAVNDLLTSMISIDKHIKKIPPFQMNKWLKKEISSINTCEIYKHQV